MFSRDIVSKLNTNNGTYSFRDQWFAEIKAIEDPELRELWMSIYYRTSYDTPWEDWQMFQYRNILSLADRTAKDICLITGFPTMTAIAYGYFDDPNFEMVYKTINDINPATMAWQNWNQSVINANFRDIMFREYDLIINTIVADVAFVEPAKLMQYYDYPESFDMDETAFQNIQPGQRVIWGWPYGGSRHTFPLLFEYPHPLWHNNDYLLERWSKWFDIKKHKFVESPPETKNELVDYKNTNLLRLRHNIQHRKTDILVVEGIRK